MFKSKRVDSGDVPLEKLTQRDREVLMLIAEGLSVREIAEKLALPPKAIDSRKYRLMRKLNLHDRVRLCRYAIRQGLIDP